MDLHDMLTHEDTVLPTYMWVDDQCESCDKPAVDRRKNCQLSLSSLLHYVSSFAELHLPHVATIDMSWHRGKIF